jgi:thiamine biosynthesis protein ThiS
VEPCLIYFNGKPVPAKPGIKLAELLKLAGRDPALAAVTVDGEFVPVADYRKLVLHAGARVKAWELLDGG